MKTDYVTTEAARCLACGSSKRTGKTKNVSIKIGDEQELEQFYTSCADCGRKRLQRVIHHKPTTNLKAVQ